MICLSFLFQKLAVVLPINQPSMLFSDRQRLPLSTIVRRPPSIIPSITLYLRLLLSLPYILGKGGRFISKIKPEIAQHTFHTNENIQVSNTPDVSSDSVAEWTVLLMLCAGRNFMEAATAIEKGQWSHSWKPMWLTGIGLHDAVVGIVGMGRIGQGVMKRILPFGVKKVLYFDIFHPIKPAEEMGAEYVEFNELLQLSDYVVCMCNLSEETKDLFNKKAFDLMHANAVFVNSSRGGVVNQKDLYEALKKKKFRAAAIDVTVPEPLPKDHELTTLPNLIITPHLASAEKNVRIKMANLAAENILLGVEGKPLKTPVPMPK